MAAVEAGGAGARRFLGILSCAFALLSGPVAAAHMTTLAYRETADSFSWEVDWDGGASAGAADITPLRSDPSLPELWTPSIRLVRGPRGFSCTFRARHDCRVHEMDAPGGAPLRLTFGRREALQGPAEWARLETRSTAHLHTGKDHKDEYDLLARTVLDGDGRKVYRLVLQGTHGLQAKPKKLKAGKAAKKKEGRRAAREGDEE